jgi:hypothetical protein
MAELLWWSSLKYSLISESQQITFIVRLFFAEGPDQILKQIQSFNVHVFKAMAMPAIILYGPRMSKDS